MYGHQQMSAGLFPDQRKSEKNQRCVDLVVHPVSAFLSLFMTYEVQLFLSELFATVVNI